MKVKIKRIDKSLSLPEYKTLGAIAFDFYTREKTVIGPKETGRVPSNYIIETPQEYALIIKDRSSTAKTKGLIITAGVIDQDYCGEKDEILIQFYNYTDKEIVIEKGERLAQGIFFKIEKGEWQEVENMKKQSRGGFGSTG